MAATFDTIHCSINVTRRVIVDGNRGFSITRVPLIIKLSFSYFFFSLNFLDSFSRNGSDYGILTRAICPDYYYSPPWFIAIRSPDSMSAIYMSADAVKYIVLIF